MPLHLFFAAGGPAPSSGADDVALRHQCPHGAIEAVAAIAHSVTTDNWAVLQSGNWSMLLRPPRGAGPGAWHPAAEPVMLALIIAASNSTPVMSVSSVSAEGTSLLTALVSCAGINIDFTDLGTVGVAGDLNFNTVKTSPTLGDYVEFHRRRAPRVALLMAAGVGDQQVEVGMARQVAPEGQLRVIQEIRKAIVGLAVHDRADGHRYDLHGDACRGRHRKLRDQPHQRPDPEGRRWG